MIVQACLNGARLAAYHPALPLTADAMAADAAACVAAGAAELHLHPRGPDGRESLASAVVDATVLAVRRTCPGTLVGVSTGAWIEGDADRTLARIEGWRELPDHASVNLSEPGAPGVMERLWRRGIGVEAGLASVADAERLVALGFGPRVLRVLVEIEVRWSLSFGRFGGSVKLGPVFRQAASLSASFPLAPYASSGVHPAKVEWGRAAL